MVVSRQWSISLSTDPTVHRLCIHQRLDNLFGFHKINVNAAIPDCVHQHRHNAHVSAGVLGFCFDYVVGIDSSIEYYGVLYNLASVQPVRRPLLCV